MKRSPVVATPCCNGMHNTRSPLQPPYEFSPPAPSPWQTKRAAWLVDAVAATELRVSTAAEASRVAAEAAAVAKEQRRAEVRNARNARRREKYADEVDAREDAAVAAAMRLEELELIVNEMRRRGMEVPPELLARLAR